MAENVDKELATPFLSFSIPQAPRQTRQGTWIVENTQRAIIFGAGVLVSIRMMITTVTIPSS